MILIWHSCYLDKLATDLRCPCNYGKISSPLLWDRKDRIALHPDASPRVGPWWLRRRPRSKASAVWSWHLLGKLGVGPAEGLGMDASWKLPARDPIHRWRDSVMWLRVFSIVATIKRLVGGALYFFFQLDVSWGSVQGFTPTSDVVLHQMFVQ